MPLFLSKLQMVIKIGLLGVWAGGACLQPLQLIHESKGTFMQPIPRLSRTRSCPGKMVFSWSPFGCHHVPRGLYLCFLPPLALPSSCQCWPTCFTLPLFLTLCPSPFLSRPFAQLLTASQNLASVGLLHLMGEEAEGTGKAPAQGHVTRESSALAMRMASQASRPCFCHGLHTWQSIKMPPAPRIGRWPYACPLQDFRDIWRHWNQAAATDAFILGGMA